MEERQQDASIYHLGRALQTCLKVLLFMILTARAFIGRKKFPTHSPNADADERSVPAAIQTQIALHVHEVQKAVGSIGQALCQRQALHGSLAAMASLSQGPAQNSRRKNGQKNVWQRLNEAFSGFQDNNSKPAAQSDRILISEVEVRGIDGDLKQLAEECITIRPNFSYTLQEIQENAMRVFSTNYFRSLSPRTKVTQDGVKLIFNVVPNETVTAVDIEGADVLPAKLIEDEFKDQHGQPLNFARVEKSRHTIDNWYRDRYLDGMVTSTTLEGGTLKIKVDEVVVNDINLRFENRKSGEVRAEGKTKPDVILRHILSQPGKIYSVKQAENDIAAVFSMGLFSDVNITPHAYRTGTPDNPKGRVDLNFNLVEKQTKGISGGGGLTSIGQSEGALPGIVANAAYSQHNLFGLNQKLNASVAIGQVDKLFRINHTDPWIRGDPHHTSRVISLQNTKSSGNIIHGRAPDDVARGAAGAQPDGNVITARTTGGVEYGRPLATGWTGTAGLNWQQTHSQDDQGRIITEDAYKSPLTFSGGKSDSMMVALLRAVYSGPHETQLVASVEQAVPIISNWLQMNRFQGRVERLLPIFRSQCKLRLGARGGMIFGDLPPTEAFPIGGTNSVRGYAEGAVGSARHFATGHSELRFPVSGPFEGVLFADYGSDFDSGQTVLGDPAGVRGKPGSGYGYGLGVRIDTSLGAVRLEYGFSDKGLGRFHLGIGSY